MKAILWVFFVAFLLYAIVWLFKDNVRDWFFPNIVQVEVSGEAKADQVSISWTAENQIDTLTIFKNGAQVTGDFRASGFNIFFVYYQGDLVDSFDQFKTTAASGHQYKFLLWKKQDSVVLDIRIAGSDAPL